MVKDAVPAVVGFPVSAPVDGFNDTPAGRVPAETDHVYGVRPPVAETACEYPVPVIPSGSVVVDTPSGANTSIVNAWVARRPSVSVTLTVNDDDPVAVGVPDTTPVVEFNEAHDGNEPADTSHVNGPTPPADASV